MFTFIFGPMKSGKSLELLARTAPYEYTNKNLIYVQPKANTRDKGVHTRLGISAPSIVVESLSEIKDNFDVISIDEAHMFDSRDAKIIKKWLDNGKDVLVSGLDLDYTGTMTAITSKLYELKPDELIPKIAVCDKCKKYDAKFTQILSGGKPILGGLPTVTIDDGTYVFEARCRTCFSRKN